MSNSQRLYVDGKQLVGGATLDFDKFDVTSSGNVKPIWLMNSSRPFPVVAADSQAQRWLDQQVDAAIKFFSGINGTVAGGGTTPMGPLLGFTFAPILYGALATFKESWSSAYLQYYGANATTWFRLPRQSCGPGQYA